MTRFNLVLDVYGVEVSVDENGEAQETRVNEKRIFGNRMTIGMSTWAARRSYGSKENTQVGIGLRPDAMVNVRTSDYDYQQRAVLNGVEYEVDAAQDKGEMTTLTMRKILRNE